MRRWELNVFWFFPKLRVIFWALAAYGTFYAFRHACASSLSSCAGSSDVSVPSVVSESARLCFLVHSGIFGIITRRLGIIGAPMAPLEAGKGEKEGERGRQKATISESQFSEPEISDSLFISPSPLAPGPCPLSPSGRARMPAPIYLLWLSLCRLRSESVSLTGGILAPRPVAVLRDG